MTKRQITFFTLGILCILAVISALYLGSYISTFYLEEWWTLPTMFLLFGVGVGSGFGGAFLFVATFSGGVFGKSRS